MIQIQLMLGLPVLFTNGKQAGRVKDIWFDEFWSLVGVVLEPRALFRRAFKAVYWKDVVSCGEDALLIGEETEIATVDRKMLLRTFHTGVVRLKDMPVYTKEGQHLGEVADVYFKETEGTQIIGYELTDGFLADVFEGRRRIFLPEQPGNVTLGEDAIFVPASYERVHT